MQGFFIFRPSVAHVQAVSFVCGGLFQNETDDTANENVLAKLQEIGPSDTILSAVWKSRFLRREKSFFPVLTEIGRCFVFNSMNLHEMYTTE